MKNNADVISISSDGTANSNIISIDNTSSSALSPSRIEFILTKGDDERMIATSHSVYSLNGGG